jgi:hypothetical protein
MLKFLKIWIKILDVANDVYYKRAKSQYKIICIQLHKNDMPLAFWCLMS